MQALFQCFVNCVGQKGAVIVILSACSNKSALFTNELIIKTKRNAS
jgi:hypothetical protein